MTIHPVSVSLLSLGLDDDEDLGPTGPAAAKGGPEANRRFIGGKKVPGAERLGT